MLWEATTTQARTAVKRLREHFADVNELRVCMPDDTVACLGERYPLARERALRLRHALHDIFTRQHVLSLAALRTLPRKDAAAFLESLTASPSSSPSVCVVGLGIHLPVDSRMRDHLADAKIVPDDMPAAEVARLISQNTRAEDALTTYLLLQEWSDELADAKRSKPTKATAETAEDAPPPKKRKPTKAAPARKPKGTKP
jgi:hypothetical protein